MSVVSEAGPNAGRSRRLIYKAVAMLSCSVLLSFDHPVFAGEKIQISSSTNSSEQVNLPKDVDPQNAIPSGLSTRRISSGESGKGPVLPPPNQPSYTRDPRIDELIDRKKNWIYEAPNRFDRDQKIEQILGVRKFELDNLDKKPKGALERFIEGDKDAQGTSKDDRDRTTTDLTGRDALTGRTGLETVNRLSGRDELQSRESGAGIIPELNPAPLFNWNAGPEGMSQIGSTFGGSSFLSRKSGESPFGNKPPEPMRQFDSGQRDFERAWDSPRGALTRFNDPINDSADATRAIMMPIAARKASVPPPGLSTQGRAGEPSYAFGNPAAPMSARPDFFSSTRDKLPGPAAANPQPAPVSTPVMQPKPMVLEIPRPRF